jgi:hypothetical protein
MAEMRNAHKILVGISKGKRPLGRWEDTIKMDLKETVCLRNIISEA